MARNEEFYYHDRSTLFVKKNAAVALLLFCCLAKITTTTRQIAATTLTGKEQVLTMGLCVCCEKRLYSVTIKVLRALLWDNMKLIMPFRLAIRVLHRANRSKSTVLVTIGALHIIGN